MCSSSHKFSCTSHPLFTCAVHGGSLTAWLSFKPSFSYLKFQLLFLDGLEWLDYFSYSFLPVIDSFIIVVGDHNRVGFGNGNPSPVKNHSCCQIILSTAFLKIPGSSCILNAVNFLVSPSKTCHSQGHRRYLCQVVYQRDS